MDWWLFSAAVCTLMGAIPAMRPIQRLLVQWIGQESNRLSLTSFGLQGMAFYFVVAGLVLRGASLEANERVLKCAVGLLCVALVAAVGSCVRDLIALDERIDSIERKSKQVSAAYDALLDEKNELRSALTSREQLSGRLMNPGSISDVSIDELKRELESSRRRIDAMAKQDEIRHAEISRLKEENEGLRSQLNDYAFVFGAERKKRA